MKIKFALGIVFLFCLAFAGCGLSKDAEVMAFSNELETLTKDMAAKVDANPSAAGVDEAQKVLDGKKDSIKKTFGELKTATGTISKETETKMTESMKRSGENIGGIATKHTGAMMKDPAMATKIQKLATDFQAMLQ